MTTKRRSPGSAQSKLSRLGKESGTTPRNRLCWAQWKGFKQIFQGLHTCTACRPRMQGMHL